MQRDPELIRLLMLKLEALPLPAMSIAMINCREDLPVDGYTSDQIIYHVDQILMNEWIDTAGDRGLNPNAQFSFRALTPAGHDFIDSVRDEVIWKLTKDGVSAAGGFTLDTLAALGKAFIKKQLEKLTGLEIP
ncbi:Hypothetical protein SAMN03159306_04946 [Pseudomonas sp. NFACC48-1]|nr:Hypothetical protein SAMN03159405_03907 [Pseudomonas sp. NFACC44-2]SDA88645.1 Hypothetical protein SAMN03159429_05417 [Pseudomonas sp. NFACC51]SFI02713.1 Hypothetical protein SAMN03159302_03207 [Pseudomonas sp. NFACC54]SFT24452.1 Hypothetical protein SAMN03159306_04946 [Pseudomonas sp. NFACC48-1]